MPNGFQKGKSVVVQREHPRLLRTLAVQEDKICLTGSYPEDGSSHTKLGQNAWAKTKVMT
jgi:hypothetical protein